MRVIVRRTVLCVLFFWAAASVHAQVTVRCGSGSTTAAGMHINSQGEVVVAEDVLVCGQSPGGPVMPSPLQLAILSPPTGHVVNVGAEPVGVQFSASIVNYAVANDQCRIVATPSIPGTPAVLSPVNGLAAVTLVFPPGFPSGTYNLALQCTRTVNGQQVVVNNPAPRSIIVNSSPGPIPCPPVAGPFTPHVVQNYSSPYGPSGGWGAPANQSVTWRSWTQTHISQPGWLTSTQLRSWKFTAPPASRMLLETSTSNVYELVTSISECPGDFHPQLARCLASGGMVWRTQSEGFGQDCVLNPGTEYYLNIAIFDLPHYLSTGQFRSNIGCPGSQCVVQMRAVAQ